MKRRRKTLSPLFDGVVNIEGVPHRIALSVDLPELARRMGWRAIHNMSGKTSLMKGVLVCHDKEMTARAAKRKREKKGEGNATDEQP